MVIIYLQNIFEPCETLFYFTESFGKVEKWATISFQFSIQNQFITYKMLSTQLCRYLGNNPNPHIISSCCKVGPGHVSASETLFILANFLRYFHYGIVYFVSLQRLGRPIRDLAIDAAQWNITYDSASVPMVPLATKV